MTVRFTCADADFDGNTIGRLSPNTLRTNLPMEFMLGVDADLTQRSTVVGGTDGGVAGAATFDPDYMGTSGALVRLVTNYNAESDRTLILVQDVGSGLNYGFNTFETPTCALYTTSAVLTFVYSGATRATLSLAALTLGVPYFYCVKLNGTTGVSKLFYGKAGTLTSVAGAGPAWSLPGARVPYSVGGDSLSLATAARRSYYAAAYSDVKSDADVSVIYNSLRNFYLGINADF